MVTLTKTDVIIFLQQKPIPEQYLNYYTTYTIRLIYRLNSRDHLVKIVHQLLPQLSSPENLLELGLIINPIPLGYSLDPD